MIFDPRDPEFSEETKTEGQTRYVTLAVVADNSSPVGNQFACRIRGGYNAEHDVTDAFFCGKVASSGRVRDDEHVLAMCEAILSNDNDDNVEYPLERVEFDVVGDYNGSAMQEWTNRIDVMVTQLRELDVRISYKFRGLNRVRHNYMLQRDATDAFGSRVKARAWAHLQSGRSQDANAIEAICLLRHHVGADKPAGKEYDPYAEEVVA